MAGLTRGLAYAGYAKGATGDEDEVAVETVAHIASDLILAGHGRDVLAIYAQATPKSDAGDDEEGRKSPLVRALERMPGLLPGTGSAPAPAEPAPEAEIVEERASVPTDLQSVATPLRPFFIPQPQLLPPELEPPRLRCDDLRATAGVALAHPGGVPGDPLPPLPPPATLVPRRAEDFEKKSARNFESAADIEKKRTTSPLPPAAATVGPGA